VNTVTARLKAEAVHPLFLLRQLQLEWIASRLRFARGRNDGTSVTARLKAEAVHPLFLLRQLQLDCFVPRND
jgi:hypothetical protein